MVCCSEKHTILDPFSGDEGLDCCSLLCACAVSFRFNSTDVGIGLSAAPASLFPLPCMYKSYSSGSVWRKRSSSDPRLAHTSRATGIGTNGLGDGDAFAGEGFTGVQWAAAGV